ncbi:serine hydrolase [Hydrogenophaga sp.]|uniref:serine hydrolase n=1 Tax=Hydrogenophaga sp. TaxID=1904254 RepID=UPI0025BDDDCF|nr:serine hydrolase [Hydrogenophaga sp.]
MTVLVLVLLALLLPLSAPSAAAAVASATKKPQIAPSASQLGSSRVTTQRELRVNGQRRAEAVRASSQTKQLRNTKRPAQAKAAQRRVQQTRAAPNRRAVAQRERPAAAGPRVSMGQRLGLRDDEDLLGLNSSVALVVDQETHEVLFSKNDSVALPIASVTKLMAGLVIADAALSMDEPITITQDDVDVYRGSSSRLAVGSTLTRAELMHLSLMSSENRAAHALGRTYPGGMQQFVRDMNLKARLLGMFDTRFVEPTGLSSGNLSSARDLAALVAVAYERPILRSLSTSPGHQVELGERVLQFNNSNRLVRDPQWQIGLQKTGFISEAGRCVVMQAKVAGRRVIMVFLDSASSLSRVQDAERVRRWVEAQNYIQLFVRPQG